MCSCSTLIYINESVGNPDTNSTDRALVILAPSKDYTGLIGSGSDRPWVIKLAELMERSGTVAYPIKKLDVIG
jgi:hypothetical protein